MKSNEDRGGPQGYPISHCTSSCDSQSLDESTLKHTDGDDNDGENGHAENGRAENGRAESGRHGNNIDADETDPTQYTLDTPSAAIKALVS